MKTIAQTYKEQFGSIKFPFKIYDAKGNTTYYEDSDSYWVRWEYDAEGNETYCEDSDSDWWRWEYDARGNETYCEDSFGEKSGTPKNSCSGKVVQIDGKKDNLRGVK